MRAPCVHSRALPPPSRGERGRIGPGAAPKGQGSHLGGAVLVQTCQRGGALAKAGVVDAEALDAPVQVGRHDDDAGRLRALDGGEEEVCEEVVSCGRGERRPRRPRRPRGAPRWFTPKVCSNPSSVRPGWEATPALRTRRWIADTRSSTSAAHRRTLSMEAKSKWTYSTRSLFASLRISAAAVVPFSSLRQSTRTRAPRSASSRAVTLPMPVLAPVTTATLSRASISPPPCAMGPNNVGRLAGCANRISPPQLPRCCLTMEEQSLRDKVPHSAAGGQCPVVTPACAAPPHAAAGRGLPGGVGPVSRLPEAESAGLCPHAPLGGVLRRRLLIARRPPRRAARGRAGGRAGVQEPSGPPRRAPQDAQEPAVAVGEPEGKNRRGRARPHQERAGGGGHQRGEAD